MESFIIESILCMAIFLIAYMLLLERENMHGFKRYYLPGSIAASFIIPLMSIPLDRNSLAYQMSLPELAIGQQASKPEIYNISAVLITIYLLGAAIAAIRFAINLSSIVSKIRFGEKLEYKQARIVLVQEKTVPHTFLHYIFINRHDYARDHLQPEVLEHELTHVRQKHTVDILFIEVCKVLFWFNPLVYIYKHAIQLNHEFLADQSVVRQYHIQRYQNILLAIGASRSGFSLTSNLNYFITKKRFIMMTTTTPAYRAILKTSLLLPVCLMLIMSLCSEATAQEIKKAPVGTKTATTQDDQVYTAVEQKPEYPGGYGEFYRFISDNFRIPEGITGRQKIIVQFVVEKDGSLGNIKVLRDAGPGTAEETLRVLKLTPKWIPGRQKGEPVRVLYSLPISISSGDRKTVEQTIQNSKKP